MHRPDHGRYPPAAGSDTHRRRKVTTPPPVTVTDIGHPMAAGLCTPRPCWPLSSDRVAGRVSLRAARSRSQPPTIKDIAERAGVSKSQVSRVMRGGWAVSPRRRAAVTAAAEELGYRPNAVARRLV